MSACGSYRYMMQDCPHNWEKMKGRAYIAEEDNKDESFFICMAKHKVQAEEVEEDNLIFYTATDKENISSLGSEALGRILLYSGCTRNVCGKDWWLVYYNSLTDKDKTKVKMEDGEEKKFRFGGGEVLKALGKVTFPARWAGQLVKFSSDAVKSSISLLWSKASMVKAGVVLNLQKTRQASSEGGPTSTSHRQDTFRYTFSQTWR